MSKTVRYNPEDFQLEKERRHVIRDIKRNKQSDYRRAFQEKLQPIDDETGIQDGDDLGC